MITRYPVLYKRMKEFGATYSDLAIIANVSKTALHLKMLGIKRWKLTEVLKICCFFRTPDAEHLFVEKRLFEFVRKYYNTNSNKSQ